jgi:hypothetical protein
VWGILLFALSPLISVFVKTKGPEYYGMLPDGEAIDPGQNENMEALILKGAGYAASFDETEFTFKQAWRTHAFWLFVVSVTINTFVNGGIGVHTVPFLTDIGISETVAGAMLSMQVFFPIPSRFFGGVIADRLDKKTAQSNGHFLVNDGLWREVLFCLPKHFFGVCFSYSHGTQRRPVNSHFNGRLGTVLWPEVLWFHLRRSASTSGAFRIFITVLFRLGI